MAAADVAAGGAVVVKTHTLIFTPSGQRVGASEGETIYEAGLRAGVDIQSICGGKGLCKRCQIEVEPGKFAKFQIDSRPENIGKLTPTEKKAIHDGELAQGRRLSCRAKVRGDLVVEIPSDSRQTETAIKKASTALDVPLKPALALHMIQLAAPTLEDNPSDGEAIIAALSHKGITAGINLSSLTKLQVLLRDHDRTVMCVVRDESQVIDIWPPSGGDLYGAAIDVGSTSLALYMFNLSTGEPVYEKAAMNPQIRYGEDLMSRVSYVMMNKGAEHRLTADIRAAVKALLMEACDQLNLEASQLLEVVMVGNPIMHHVFNAINPVELGVAPFTLAIKAWLDADARDLDLGLPDHARVAWLPLIGGHVGADTAAAYLTQMDHMKARSTLLVDIGTNAEIVLSHQGRIAAASSPTGPALEGAEISCGVRASAGAIERVRIDPVTKDGRVKIIGHDDWLADHDGSLGAQTITGICGSGIFEVMVELANAGLLDQSGLFIPSAAPHRFSQMGNVWTYCLIDHPAHPIFIKQTDIRAVQLAKAALFAGAQLLAQSVGCEAFDDVLLAGAFGTHLDPHYVAQIGIVPHAPASIIRSIGNAAGMGASMTLLNTDEKAKIIAAVKTIEKMETATEAKFQDYFVAAMKFPTAQKGEGGAKRRRRKRA